MKTADASFGANPVLVLGGTGAVGRYLLRRLSEQGFSVLAVSRREQPPAWASAWSGLNWHRADLTQLDFPELCAERMPSAFDLLSVGPLDALAEAFERGLPSGLRRVVALSSLSVEWKRGSPNPYERALVDRLLAAENTLRNRLMRAGVELCVLRPGMIYGAGIDRSLSPLLQCARRWRLLPWPMHARGLRAPVHADDIAAAVRSALALPGEGQAPRIYALPGPRALPFVDLVDEMLHALAPGARRVPIPLPSGMWRWLARLGGRLGRLSAVLWRSALDQCSQPGDWAILGHRPRPFRALAEDFVVWSE